MAGEHIVKSYDRELDELRDTVLEMGEEAGEQLARVIKALLTSDQVLAQEVVAGDERINRLQGRVDDLTVRLIAKRQPLAVDLRHVVAALKIAADLERIADYARNIAKHTIELTSAFPRGPVEAIEAMAHLGYGMLRDVLDAYRTHDSRKAVEVWHRDDEIDRLYTEFISGLGSFILAGREHLEAYTALVFAARCCERIGDHLTNVAEHILFISASGEEVGKVRG